MTTIARVSLVLLLAIAVCFIAQGVFVAPAVAAPALQSQTVPNPIGTYSTDVGAGTYPIVTLSINDDGTAVAVVVYQDADPTVYEGVWVLGASGALTVNATDTANQRSVSVIFDQGGNTLTAVKYPKSLLGNAGLTLVKTSATGTSKDEMLAAPGATATVTAPAAMETVTATEATTDTAVVATEVTAATEAAPAATEADASEAVTPTEAAPVATSEAATETATVAATAVATEAATPEVAPARTVSVTSATPLGNIITAKQPVGARLSPDGQYIAYYEQTGRARKTEQQICVYTFSNAGTKCFKFADKAFLGYPYQLQWSPDSTQIAFSENPIQLGYESDIWLFTRDTGTLTALTNDGVTGSWSSEQTQSSTPLNIDYLPMWNPNDGQIYFWRVNPKGNMTWDLSLMRIAPAGGTPDVVRELTTELPGVLPWFNYEAMFLDGMTAIGPDGKVVAALLASPNSMGAITLGLYSINLADASIAPQAVITETQWNAAIPAWQGYPATPVGLAWKADGATLVVMANSDSTQTPFNVFYTIDVATGASKPVVDFSGLESYESLTEDAPGTNIPWRYFSPWTASLSPEGDQLLMLNDLGGVVGLMVAPLPATGDLPNLVQTSQSFNTSTVAQSSRSKDGKVMMYELLLDVTEK